MIAILAAALVAAGGEGQRQENFLELLRTYPSRPVAESVALVSGLVDEGPFAERDRALFWLGSVRLSTHDLPGARGFWARLRREHPGSAWLERADLGEADASAQERDYGDALRWLARTAQAKDPAVRELSRLTTAQFAQARTRQRLAFAAGAFACLVLIALILSIARRRPMALLPLPAEARIFLPVLGVLALLSVRQDPAPRAAVLTICAAGALLLTAGGLRLRAVQARAPERALQAGVTLLALFCASYAAIYRADLVNMVLETVRAGPE